MYKSAIYAFLILTIFSLTALAGDLYLLDIQSQPDLDKVRSVVDNAHGMINGKFIVYLDRQQINALKTDGIQLTLLAENCRLDDYYLVMRDHSKPTRAVLSLSPLYSTPNSWVLKLEKSSTNILQRDWYMVFNLAEKQTPFFYNQPTLPAPSRDYYPFDTLAALINQDSLYSYVNSLQAFYTRFTPTDSCRKARDWIVNKFASFGYTDISLQSFYAYSDYFNVFNEPAWNVVCVKEGTEKPDEWIIIGGHYDSITWETAGDPYAPAPGADDNASGVAATLELARIYKDIDFKRSVMFVAWCGEELGLQGSDYMAMQMYDDGVDIEFVANFDVIAYEADSIHEVTIFGSPYLDYCQVFCDAADRITDLIPDVFNGSGSSDDASFSYMGYNTTGFFEYTLHPHMHTMYDVIDSMDFDYMTEIVKMGVAGIPIIDASPEPIASKMYDIGDGHSLRLVWDSVYTDFSYKIIYGRNYYLYQDTIEVPAHTYSVDLTGLTEGIQYGAAVFGVSESEYVPISFIISYGRPNSIPRQTQDFALDIDTTGLILSWSPNAELDINHYKLSRQDSGGPWEVLDDNVTGVEYVDSQVAPHHNYGYRVVAVDNDLNESAASRVVSGTPATFDAGILLVDETQVCGFLPGESYQLMFFDHIFGDSDFTMINIDSSSQAADRSTLGQYGSVFWIGDDNCYQNLENSLDSLDWYLQYSDDFFLAGWRSIYSFTGTQYFYAGNTIHDDFGISYINENPLADFEGATAEEGWPALEIRPDAPGSGNIDHIDLFEPAPGAKVIYRFNSASSNPYFSNKPVGIAYDTHHGKRVVLGFPLYFLTEESAQALIARTFEYFAEEAVLYGDVNGDWETNIFDITYIISYLYLDGPPPVIMNNADVNGDCTINIFDITYLITYLYLNGSEPVEGCVE
jgi:hypothetical protein